MYTIMYNQDPSLTEMAEKSRSVCNKIPEIEVLAFFAQLNIEIRIIMKTKSIILTPHFFSNTDI